MLPAERRVRRPQDFAFTIRRGVRAGRRTLVVHCAREADASPARAGFVVSKAVGNSVIRHKVVRRLRHLVAPLLVDLPAGTRVVVRALAPAASATGPDLGADLSSALRTAMKKSGNGD